MAFRKPMRLEKWIAFDGAVGADVLAEVIDPHDGDGGDPDVEKVFEYGRDDGDAAESGDIPENSAEAENHTVLAFGMSRLRSNTYTEQYDLNGHSGKETSVTLPNTIASDGVNPSLPFHDIARISWVGTNISSRSIFMEVIAPNYGENGRLTFLRQDDTETLNYLIGAGVLSVGDEIAFVVDDSPGRTQNLYSGVISQSGANHLINATSIIGKVYATDYSVRFSQDAFGNYANRLLTLMLESVLYIPEDGAGVHSDGAKLNLFYIGDDMNASSPPGALEESDSSYYTDDLFKGETQYKPSENTDEPGGNNDGGDEGNEDPDPEPDTPVVVRPPVVEDPVDPVPEPEDDTGKAVTPIWPDPVVPPVAGGGDSGPGDADGSGADATDAVRDGTDGQDAAGAADAGSNASSGAGGDSVGGVDSGAGPESAGGVSGQFAYIHRDVEEYDELSGAQNTLSGEAGAVTIMGQAATVGEGEMEPASMALGLELIGDLGVWREAVRVDRQALAQALANLQDEYQSRSQEEWGEMREALRGLFVNGSGEMRAINRILGEMDRQMLDFGSCPPERRDGMMLATLRELANSAERRSGETGALSKAVEAVALALREARLAHEAGPDAAEVEAVFARVHDEALAEWELMLSRSDSMGKALAVKQMVAK